MDKLIEFVFELFILAMIVAALAFAFLKTAVENIKEIVKAWREK